MPSVGGCTNPAPMVRIFLIFDTDPPGETYSMMIFLSRSFSSWTFILMNSSGLAFVTRQKSLTDSGGRFAIPRSTLEIIWPDV